MAPFVTLEWDDDVNGNEVIELIAAFQDESAPISRASIEENESAREVVVRLENNFNGTAAGVVLAKVKDTVMTLEYSAGRGDLALKVTEGAGAPQKIQTNPLVLACGLKVWVH